MTTVVFVKVYDGVVLAADSATTLTLVDESGRGLGHQVYNTANKVFQLHRQLPVAAATWGLGQLGSASIASLAKDLRARLMGDFQPDGIEPLDPDAYSIKEVTSRLVDFFFDDLYSHLVEEVGNTLGFVVAGYGPRSLDSEAWVVELSDPNVRPEPFEVAGPDQSGWAAFAQNGPAYRLFNGYDPRLPADLVGQGVDPEILDRVLSAYHEPAAVPAMPLMDAIALARFLIRTTAEYQRFALGPDTVGGEVDVAAISRHEGFKWIRRKHYYDSQLNPKDY